MIFLFRYYEDDGASSSHRASLARSLSQPSLARSASEFTERWAAPSRYDTASEFTSPEGTPKSQRSTRIQPLHVPRGSGGGAWESAGAVGVAREYRTEASTSFVRKKWHGDDYSEDSYK